MLTTRGENYTLSLYKRKENSSYEWEEQPLLTFCGRPAGTIEKKNYRVMKGVDGNTDSNFVFCSNLPEEVAPNDKVLYLGKYWTVESIGYYYENNLVVNAKLMNDEYLMKRCPKGIALK